MLGTSTFKSSHYRQREPQAESLTLRPLNPRDHCRHRQPEAASLLLRRFSLRPQHHCRQQEPQAKTLMFRRLKLRDHRQQRECQAESLLPRRLNPRDHCRPRSPRRKACCAEVVREIYDIVQTLHRDSPRRLNGVLVARCFQSSSLYTQPINMFAIKRLRAS